MRALLGQPILRGQVLWLLVLKIDAVDLESSKLGFRSRDGLDLDWPALTGLKLQMIPAWQSQIQLEFPVYDCIGDSPDLTKMSGVQRLCRRGNSGLSVSTV